MRISGEVVLPIRHHLLTKSGNLDGVTTVCAHAQALAQCQQWLSVHTPQLKRQAVSSNAEAARMASLDPSFGSNCWRSCSRGLRIAGGGRTDSG